MYFILEVPTCQNTATVPVMYIYYIQNINAQKETVKLTTMASDLYDFENCLLAILARCLFPVADWEALTICVSFYFFAFCFVFACSTYM